MAAPVEAPGGKDSKDKKVRSKKGNPFVDLTAMVDLAFLLITFFMLTTTLSKPQSMNLAMPDKADINDPNPDKNTKVSDWRTVTVLLGDDDQLVWYWGLLATPKEGPSKDIYGKEGLRKVILRKQQQVLVEGKNYPVEEGEEGKERGLIVIIKPSDKSTYKNLVDVLDEMAITQTQTYAIVDITEDEVEVLAENGLIKSNLTE